MNIFGNFDILLNVKGQTFAAEKEIKTGAKRSLNFKIVEEWWIFNHFETNCSYLKWLKMCSNSWPGNFQKGSSQSQILVAIKACI